MNNTTSSCVIPDRISGFWLVVVFSVGSIVSFISVFGNGVILIAFVKTKSLHKPCYVFLTNLALGDCLYAMVGFPMYFITDFVHEWWCNPVFYYFRIFILAMLIMVSINNIALIALERFIGIRFPFTYGSNMTVNRCYILVLSSWLFAAARAMVMSGTYFVNQKPAVSIEIFIIIFLLIFTVVIYSYVYVVSRRHLIRDKTFGIKQESKSKTVVYIAMVNALSWLPVILVRLIDMLIIDSRYWVQATFLSPFIGTCFNLLIYTYRLKDYRNVVKKMLRCVVQVSPAHDMPTKVGDGQLVVTDIP